MRKNNILKLCGVVLAFPLVLVGCATVSDVIDQTTNKSIYFEEITSFGGNATKVGDYLYFGNAYSSVSDSSFNYNSASSNGYLARFNLSNEISTDGKAPKGELEKVNDKLVGYDNQYMFAFQNYLYFTSANTHKTSSLENDYSRVSMFRVKFNGDDMTELFTTKYDSSSFIKAVEGSDGNGYIVTYAKTDSTEANRKDNYDINVMKIGDKLGKRETVAENVTSAVVDDNRKSVDKNIYFTKNSEKGKETTEVFSFDFANKTKKQLETRVGSTTKLISKVDDQLFYSFNYLASGNEIYKTDLTSLHLSIGDETDKFYPSETMSNIYHVAVGDIVYEGYVFVGNSSLMYYNIRNKEWKTLLSSSKFSDILFVDGSYVYFSNSTSIGRVSFKNSISEEAETLVSMTKIISGKYAFINNYIYFYAQYQPVEERDENGEIIEYEKDESVYLYRIQAGDSQDIASYQLISQNKKMPKIEKTEE